MTSQKRIECKIIGLVQGVFFRDFVTKEAQTRHLTGIVRNESNNSVFVIAEGDENNLKAFIEILKRGPSSARVERLEVAWKEAAGEFSDFRVAL